DGDCRARRVLLELTDETKAIQLRQARIAQHEIGGRQLDLGECVRTVLRQRDGEANLLEADLEQPGRFRIRLDEEYLLVSHAPASRTKWRGEARIKGKSGLRNPGARKRAFVGGAGGPDTLYEMLRARGGIVTLVLLAGPLLARPAHAQAPPPTSASAPDKH